MDLQTMAAMRARNLSVRETSRTAALPEADGESAIGDEATRIGCFTWPRAVFELPPLALDPNAP